MASGDVIYLADKETLDLTKSKADDIHNIVENIIVDVNVISNDMAKKNLLVINKNMSLNATATILVDIPIGKGKIHALNVMADNTYECYLRVTIDGVAITFNDSIDDVLLGFVQAHAYNYSRARIGGKWRTIDKNAYFSDLTIVNGIIIPPTSNIAAVPLNSAINFHSSLKVEVWGQSGKSLNTDIEIEF